MNDLTVTGKQNFMGIEIPVLAGGFGKDKRCMSDKTVAEIHSQPVTEIRRRIADNIKRFKESVDYIDLKKVMAHSHNNLLYELGYSKMEISKAEHIYTLSERGYAKLIKIMDSDLAWEIHDKLIDEYFELREEKQNAVGSKKKVPLSSANMMVKNIMSTLEKANVAPLYVAAEVKRLYTDLGYEVKAPLITDETAPELYTCEQIAKKLGVMSKSGLPHNQAIADIIRKLDINDDEWENTAYSQNGHDGIAVQYKQSVVDKVIYWLEGNDYPSKIPYIDASGIPKQRAVIYK